MNFFACREGENRTEMNSYLEVMNEIHVLFVDHELDDLVNVTSLLEACHYRGYLFICLFVYYYHDVNFVFPY